MKSLNNSEFIGLTKLEEYIKAIPSNGFSNVSAEPIADDQFYFDPNTKTAHVKSSSTKRGFFNMLFDNVKVGDVIEVECEFYSVSGVKPKFGIDEILNMYSPNTSTTVATTQCTTNQWETLKLRFLVTKLTYSGDFKINFGIWTSDVGEFYMRNARAKVISKLRNDKSIPTFKKYVIRKNVDTWEIRKDIFLSDNATLSVKDATTLLLKYDVPFDLPTTQKSPIVTATGDFSYSSYKYRPVVGNSLSTQVEIKLINNSGVAADLSTVENFTHFSVVAIG